MSIILSFLFGLIAGLIGGFIGGALVIRNNVKKAKSLNELTDKLIDNTAGNDR